MFTFTVGLALAACLSVRAIAVTSASRDGSLPSTVNPFAAGASDPAADTLQNEQAMVRTVLAPAHDWHVATLVSLTEVEDLLDSLESHGVRGGEVIAITDHCFAVRWK